MTETLELPQTETIDLPEAPETPQREEILARERCDHGSCSAQAYVAVRFESSVEEVDHPGELLFCGHHFTKHEDHLREFVVRDDREKLLAPLTAAY